MALNLDRGEEGQPALQVPWQPWLPLVEHISVRCFVRVSAQMLMEGFCSLGPLRSQGGRALQRKFTCDAASHRWLFLKLLFRSEVCGA